MGHQNIYIKYYNLCGESGIAYLYNILYQGAATNLDKDLQKNFGLGGAIVLKLTLVQTDTSSILTIFFVL